MDIRENKNLGVYVTICITLIGWAVTFGANKNQIIQNEHKIEQLESQHAADYERLLSKQDSTDTLLNNINTQLVELNTKMTLLLNGKLNAGGNK